MTFSARSTDRGFGDTLRKAAGLGSEDFRTPFRRISRFWLNEINNGFLRERDPYGNPWEHLSPLTIRLKRERGSRFPTSILRDEDLLRQSFHAEVNRKGFTLFTDRIFDDGTTPEIHQFGGVNADGRPVPARPFFPTGDFPPHWVQVAEAYLDDEFDRIFR